MQMIYDNFYEFAEEHQELAEFFLDKERGYFSYFDEGEEVPNDWDKRAFTIMRIYKNMKNTVEMIAPVLIIRHFLSLINSTEKS